ncbi:hypothetical protein EV383_5415 [Pseudonocardia sediminis]|uniref:Uncharacterized protein n=1 Tax=Pseudonocardia sediminis TaxID=1397368 RepID=A0A4Q7V6R0_PSEST|nr:hypothetical protein [Pseudonocardia sediminis]RZT88473.1 hypothetical protein EV383_5415 [Pseudonocardia sediminis]
MPPDSSSVGRYRARVLADAAGRRIRRSVSRGEKDSVIVCGTCDRWLVVGHDPDSEDLEATAFLCGRCRGLNDAAAAVPVSPGDDPDDPGGAPGPVSHEWWLPLEPANPWLKRPFGE